MEPSYISVCAPINTSMFSPMEHLLHCRVVVTGLCEASYAYQVLLPAGHLSNCSQLSALQEECVIVIFGTICACNVTL